MREIAVEEIKKQVSDLLVQANFELGEPIIKKLKEAMETERSSVARDILSQILENAEVARRERLPLCQDCGLVVVFADIGQEVRVTGGELTAAINQGVGAAYEENYLRKSIVTSPLRRINSGDNTPAVIHYNIVPGNQIRLQVMPKGGGCENMSYQKMLTPAEGLQGLIKFVLKSVSVSGANPCPPIILGIGIGGNFENSALLAKKALLRELGTPNPDPELDNMEQQILTMVNQLGIGPQGMGGDTTALGVHIMEAPCHIASLPVALNIECHSHRHKEIII